MLNGGLVAIAAAISPGASIDGWFAGVLVAAGLATITTTASALLAIDDDETWQRNVVRRQARRAGAIASDVPGVVFLEIDGLAHEVLRRALRDGNAPVMARWLREDTHRLERWETDWSSQTGACQAGLLHGSNHDMPAFRWWEKDRGRAIVTNHPRDAQELERRHSDGRGLLHEDGASRANILSGDAPHSMLTMSTVLVRGRRTARARLRRVLRTPVRGRAHGGAGLRRLRARAPRAGAAGPRRRAAKDPALAHVRARARVGDGGAARPAGLRHRRRHDGRPARRLLDLPGLRRGGPPFGHRAPRHPGRPAPGRPPDRAGADGDPRRRAALRARPPVGSRSVPGSDLRPTLGRDARGPRALGVRRRLRSKRTPAARTRRSPISGPA